MLPGCSVNFTFQRSRQHRRGLVSFARRQKIAKISSEGAYPLVLPGCSVNFAFPAFLGLHNHTASHSSTPIATRQPANTLRSATFQMMRRKNGMTARGRYT